MAFNKGSLSETWEKLKEDRQVRFKIRPDYEDGLSAAGESDTSFSRDDL